MIRVLIIDDSPLVRTLLTAILNDASGIQVVGVAADPYFARDKFKRLKPDVITLDVEMPRMDGLTFLEKLMNYKPTPVVMISSLTQKGAETTIKALALGAVDFVTKPVRNIEAELSALAENIVEKVRAAAGARLHNLKPAKKLTATPKITVDAVVRPAAKSMQSGSREAVICIGASTGGTMAIEQLLKKTPAGIPGMVIVQHMPAGFTAAFAKRLNGLSDFEVVEAISGMEVKNGRVIIAQGDKHLLLQRGTSGYFVQVKDGPPVNRHKPSIDVMFRSAVNSAGKPALGILLTGMGADGARGLKEMHDSGAFTIAQDEKSCVIYGMPKVAVELGGVSRIASLDHIPSLILGNAG